MLKLLTALLTTLGVINSSFAQDHAKLVPPNAAAFVSINFAHLWDTEPLKPIQGWVARFAADPTSRIIPDIGLDYANISRVTMIWPVFPIESREEEPFILLSTRTPFNEVRLFKALGAVHASQVRDFGGGPMKADVAVRRAGQPPVSGTSHSTEFYLTKDRRSGFYRIDAKTLLFLPRRTSERAAFTFLGQQLKKEPVGPLTDGLKELAQHDIVIATQVEPTRQLLEGDRMPPALVPYRALLKADRVVATIDVNDSLSITARMRFNNPADATRAKPIVETMFKEVRKTMNLMLADPKAIDETMKEIWTPLFRVATRMIDDANLTTTDNVLSVSMTGKFGDALATVLTKAPALIQRSADHAQSFNHIKQIGLTMHGYHDANGRFPTDIVDADGKPILSWRVHLLPYIEQNQLYQQIDRTKAWDDPANKKLWDKMPKVYAFPGRAAKPGMTYFQMPFSKKGLAFKRPGEGRNLTSVTDGLSNTIMVVEARDAVNWMKPDDVAIDDNIMPKFGDAKERIFIVGMGDGSVRSLSQSIKMKTLKALLTPTGGEVYDYEELDQ